MTNHIVPEKPEKPYSIHDEVDSLMDEIFGDSVNVEPKKTNAPTWLCHSCLRQTSSVTNRQTCQFCGVERYRGGV